MAYNQIILLNKRQFKEWLIMLLFSALFNLLFVRELSPLQSTYFCYDSGCFYIIAKAWFDGYTPYLDYFDHKGPMLYLIYVLAYLIAGASKWGMFIIWSFLFSWIVWWLRDIGNILNIQKKYFYIAFTTFLFYYVAFSSIDGYCCEIISLPFQVLPIWIFARNLKYNAGKHRFLDALSYGLCFGSLILIRPNNACINIALLIVCVILYIKRGWYKELFRSSLVFIWGCIIIVSPFLIYFISKGALSDFYYCYLTFNLKYKTDWAIAKACMVSNSIRIIPILIISILAAWQNRKTSVDCWLSLSMAIASVIIAIVYILGRSSLHYFLILAPIAFISFMLVIRKENISILTYILVVLSYFLITFVCYSLGVGTYKYILIPVLIVLAIVIGIKRKSPILCIIIIMLIPIYDFSVEIPRVLFESQIKEKSNKSKCKKILSIIPISEADSIYSDEAFTSVFLFQHINSKPLNKFFNLPSTILINVDPSLEKEILTNFQKISPKWIITSGSPTSILLDDINMHYGLKYSIDNTTVNEHICIYKRNGSPSLAQ